jgi:hypothetical protein
MAKTPRKQISVLYTADDELAKIIQVRIKSTPGQIHKKGTIVGELIHKEYLETVKKVGK